MGKKKTILVVDDDEMLRSFFMRILKAEGHDVVTAENGEVAIEIMEKEDFNMSLAIIDLLMPFRSGWELIENIRKNPKHKDVPLIAITGLAASFKEFDKIKKICFAIIHKGDFELELFKETVQKALSEKRKN